MRPGRAADHSFPSSAVVMEYMCVCVCVYIYIYSMTTALEGVPASFTIIVAKIPKILCMFN